MRLTELKLGFRSYLGIAVFLVLAALITGCNREQPDYAHMVLEKGSPPGTRTGFAAKGKCLAGAVVIAKQDKAGKLVVETGELGPTTVSSAPIVELPIYYRKITGVPTPVQPVFSELDYKEKALLNGYCSLLQPEKDTLWHQIPLRFAITKLIRYWNKHKKIISGDYALAIIDYSNTGDAEDTSDGAFWAQMKEEKNNGCASALNPLRNSVIRVNPKEEKSPGDIYIQPLTLSASQRKEAKGVISYLTENGEPPFLITIWDADGEVLLRGITFLSETEYLDVELHGPPDPSKPIPNQSFK